MEGIEMANKDVIFQYYDLFAKGDFDTMKRDCFHPQATWTMPGHHPLSGRMEGANACAAFLQALSKAGIWVEDIHIGELDDGTIVEKHMGHAKYDDGTVVDFPTCTTYGFKDGKIFDVRVHTLAPQTVEMYMWWRFPLKGIPDRLAQK
jgi:ketosteroid isomerase-like protein